MIDKLKEFLKKNFAISLLLSLVLYLFILPLIKDNSLINHIIKMILLLTIVASAFVLVPVKKRTKIFKTLFGLILISIAVDFFIEEVYFQFLSMVLWIMFFMKVFYQIFRIALDKNHQPGEAMIVSVSGYFVLGIIAAMLFHVMQIMDPHTFEVGFKMSDLLYFSFVTMSTLGYGDILPKSDEAKTLVMMLTLIGQLYVAIVIAFNLAKYMTILNNENLDKEKDDKISQLEEKLDRVLEKLDKK